MIAERRLLATGLVFLAYTAMPWSMALAETSADHDEADRMDTNKDMLEQLRAGWDRGFFLASTDERYRLDISGQIQVRYMANVRDEPDDGDGTTTGFQQRRTKLGFTGQLAEPNIRFRVRPVVSRNGGNVSVDDVWVAYSPMEGLNIKAGSFKLPFTRETIQSSTRLQTLERSYVNATLGFGRSTGVEVSYDAGPVRMAGMFSDGGGSDFEGFQNSNTDFAVTGRVDAKLLGDWFYFRDFSGYSDYELGAFVGGAVHCEAGNTDDDTKDFFTWTFDGSLYYQNLGIYGAAIVRHATRTAAGVDKYDDFGWLVQGGYMIDDRFEPYVRYEQLIPDSRRENAGTMNLLTAGLNYYLHGHNAKFTADVVYAFDPLVDIDGMGGGSNGLGLLTDSPGNDGQLVFRTQFQLLF